jgi:hypothetical protein
MHGDTPPKVHGGESTSQSTTQTPRTSPNPLMVESFYAPRSAETRPLKSHAPKSRLCWSTSKKMQTTVSNVNGKIMTSGRRASGFVLESCDRQVHINLPVLIECDNIPNNKQEIPSEKVTRHHQHLCDIELERLDDS